MVFHLTAASAPLLLVFCWPLLVFILVIVPSKSHGVKPLPPLFGYRSIKKPRRKTTTAASAVTYTPPTPTTPQKEEPFEFLPIKVAGVTFKNGNKSRQSILRALKFRDGEFAEGVDLELKAYEYEGQPAYGIYANGQQIGSVPANMVSYISDNYERIIDFAGIEVYGGGRDKEGNAISYGCEVILKLKKAALTAAQ